MNQAAFEVGQLAQRLGEGYYAHAATLHIAVDPRAASLLPDPAPGQTMSGFVGRKDGSHHAFDFKHYLAQAQADPTITTQLDRIWLAGSLLSLGDALQDHKYFDHAPELELVYHLRNGVAHGNKFNLIALGTKRLKQYPAHNRTAAITGKTEFEITPGLEGMPVLFDFMAPADVLDTIFSVGMYLQNLEVGDVNKT
jgi:hypothetical protein